MCHKTFTNIRYSFQLFHKSLMNLGSERRSDDLLHMRKPPLSRLELIGGAKPRLLSWCDWLSKRISLLIYKIQAPSWGNRSISCHNSRAVMSLCIRALQCHLPWPMEGDSAASGNFVKYINWKDSALRINSCRAKLIYCAEICQPIKSIICPTWGIVVPLHWTEWS